jgi:aryl-alcohol dehydrogenase-like predicted oxidoreductase
MIQRQFGRTGTSLSAIGLGVMPLAIQNRPSEAEAVRVIHAALDAGMTWLDTADSYCLDDDDFGYGERLAARALREWPKRGADVPIVTKGGYRRPGESWELDGRPERLRAACDASLRALGASTIFLYFLHGPDPDVPFAESVGALSDLKAKGKIRHIGLSNVDAAQLREAMTVTDVACVQNRCNTHDRHCFSNGIVDACEQHGLAFIAHSPVGGHKGSARIANDPTLTTVAKRYGASPHQVALAWLLASSPALFAIPGATRIASAQSSAAAGEMALTREAQRELDAAFPRLSLALRQLVAVRREVRHIARKVRTTTRRAIRRYLG